MVRTHRYTKILYNVWGVLSIAIHQKCVGTLMTLLFGEVNFALYEGRDETGGLR